MAQPSVGYPQVEEYTGSTKVQPPEPDNEADLDRHCDYLAQNMAIIESNVDSLKKTLCVPVAEICECASHPEPQTLSDFLTELNGRMENVIISLNNLITALRATVGELKILG